MRRLHLLALLALFTTSCINLDREIFYLGVTVFGTLGLLGALGLRSALRHPNSIGPVTLAVIWLTGGFILYVTARSTELFAPWPGTISGEFVLLLWLPQTLAVYPFVATGRYLADRSPGDRLPWRITAAVVAVYVGLLIHASTRVLRPSLDGPVVEVAVGATDSYARTAAGTLVDLPQNALRGRYKTVRSSDDLTLALEDSGRLVRLRGLRVDAALPDTISTFAISGERACAVDTAGQLLCFKASRYNEDPGPHLAAPTLLREFSAVAAVALGDELVCALDRAGAVTCADFPSDSDTPGQPVRLAASDVRGLAVYGATVCLLARAGTVACQTDPAPDSTLRPVPELADVAELVAGDYHACARTTAGAVRCWGGNGWNQLGPDSLGDARDVPVEIPLAGPATAVFAGDTSTCAALADGSFYCWGAQKVRGSVLWGEICDNRLLRDDTVCSDHPYKIDAPTTAIPAR